MYQKWETVWKNLFSIDGKVNEEKPASKLLKNFLHFREKLKRKTDLIFKWKTSQNPCVEDGREKSKDLLRVKTNPLSIGLQLIAQLHRHYVYRIHSKIHLLFPAQIYAHHLPSLKTHL